MKRRLEVPYPHGVEQLIGTRALADDVQIGFQEYPVPPTCDKGLVLGVVSSDHLAESCPLTMVLGIRMSETPSMRKRT